MTAVLPVIFGALFTTIVSFCLGLLLLEGLGVKLYRGERGPIALVLGSALLSLAVFFLLAAWSAKTWVFVVLGLGAMAGAVWRRSWRNAREDALPPLPGWWKGLIALALLTYGLFTLAHAMAPETSPDGTAYHLGTVGRYFREGGFRWYTGSMYANMPMGVEMLFLFAYAFGKHSAAALVHWQFYVALPFLLLHCGRRFGHPVAGAAAGLLVFLAPVAGIDGASAYVDLATAAVVFGVFYLLLIWEQERTFGLLPAIGLLSGFAYTCKMTAFMAVPFAILFVAWTLRRSGKALFRPVLAVGFIAALTIAPWLARNALMLGNPFSPFMNKWFPNPHARISFEEEYRAALRNYYGTIKSASEIPLEVTVNGGKLNGLIGPVFLMLPVALLALRWPLGRRALLATAVFLAAYPNNIGTRFLLTALPFAALSLALVLSHWRGMATAVVLFHAFFSWPGAVKIYAAEHTWRLDRFRWKAALRLESEDGFLRRYVPYYPIARMIEAHVPEHGRVLTFGTVAQAYTSREVLVVYEAGLNNVAGEMMAAGISPDYQPTRLWQYKFVPRRVRRLRLLQTASVPEMWSASEIRVISDAGREIPRDHAWRIRSNPNPWNVQWAFDDCPITRWRGRQAARPGQWIEVDLGRTLGVGAVHVEASPDQRTSARLEGENPEGKWEVLSPAPEILPVAPVSGARRIATDDLKRIGITHLAIGDSDFIADDLFRNQAAWSITLLGEAGGAKLYRLE